MPPTRYRFEPVLRDERVTPYPEIPRLATWCAAFDREGLTPEEDGASAGNLSFRTVAGFVITASRTRTKTGLSADDLVEVVRVDLRDTDVGVIHYFAAGGRVPSSDTMMHHMIYAARTDVTAVFHGHDPFVLAAGEALGVPVTGRDTAYGSIDDAIECAESLGQHDYIIRRNHGFVAVGRTMDHAGKVAIAIGRRAREIAAEDTSQRGIQAPRVGR